MRTLHAEGVAHGDIHSGNVAVRAPDGGLVASALRAVTGARPEFVLFDYGEAAVLPLSEHYVASKGWPPRDVRLGALQKAIGELRALGDATVATSGAFETALATNRALLRARRGSAPETKMVFEDMLAYLKAREYDVAQGRVLLGIELGAPGGAKAFV